MDNVHSMQQTVRSLVEIVRSQIEKVEEYLDAGAVMDAGQMNTLAEVCHTAADCLRELALKDGSAGIGKAMADELQSLSQRYRDAEGQVKELRNDRASRGTSTCP